MALRAQSLWLYGYTVTTSNQNIDWTVNGTTLTVAVPAGTYSLTSLMSQVVLSMNSVDLSNTYLVTADRTVSSGTQNRVTIACPSASTFTLLFSSGVNAPTSIRTLLGFSATDRTGHLTYTGTSTTGTSFVTVVSDNAFAGYSYLPTSLMPVNIGQINVSTSGNKETIIWSNQFYWKCQFKYINGTTSSSDLFMNWVPLVNWMIGQNLIEFTPEITSPSVFFEGWLEKGGGGSGLEFTFKEMIPSNPFYYDTGEMVFKVRPT